MEAGEGLLMFADWECSGDGVGSPSAGELLRRLLFGLYTVPTVSRRQAGFSSCCWWKTGQETLG